ncbi:MAG: 50S ribosomal protein L23 [Patescibacteria group bacterium]|nr:50S ribosomal protein L23 [Patescibacteria group bacterium]
MALLDVFKKGKKDEKKETSIKKKDSVAKNTEKSKKAVNIYSAAHRCLLKPVVSEKGADLNISNKYVFQVKSSASKQEIARAIYAVYGIKPIKVNVINLSGKSRRYGKTVGQTSAKKKAIVTLPAGKSIQIYEGV